MTQMMADTIRRSSTLGTPMGQDHRRLVLVCPKLRRIGRMLAHLPLDAHAVMAGVKPNAARKYCDCSVQEIAHGVLLPRIHRGDVPQPMKSALSGAVNPN
jgi:hypothetical protein